MLNRVAATIALLASRATWPCVSAGGGSRTWARLSAPDSGSVYNGQRRLAAPARLMVATASTCAKLLAALMRFGLGASRLSVQYHRS